MSRNSPWPSAWISAPCRNSGRSAWSSSAGMCRSSLATWQTGKGATSRPSSRPRSPGPARDFYLFDFPDKLIGFASPTDRKALVKWIRSALWHPRNFPPAGPTGPSFGPTPAPKIVLAFDLADAVSPKLVQPWLSTFDVVKKTHTDPSLLRARLASVKSAFLIVKVDQGIEGNLRIDFDSEVDYTTLVARTLIQDIVENFGVELPEMKTWNLSFDKKKAVEMTGRMSEESIRKVLSLAHPPQLASERATTAEAPSTASKAETNSAVPYNRAPARRRQRLAGILSVGHLAHRGSEGDRSPHLSQHQDLVRPLRQADRGVAAPGRRQGAARLGRGGRPHLERDVVGRQLLLTESEVHPGNEPPRARMAEYDYSGSSRAYDASVIKKQADSQMSVDLDKRWQALETSISDMRRKMVEKYKVDF